MLKYIDLVKDAKKNGTWNESTMWSSVESISEMLEDLKKDDPKAFWGFMREQHGILSGEHYDEKFAMHDVANMSWEGRDGEMHHGAYWTFEQVKEATKGKQFPKGTTPYDVFVAYNATATDLCTKFSDKELLDAAYLTWFSDVDWSENGSSTKIWEYMCYKTMK